MKTKQFLIILLIVLLSSFTGETTPPYSNESPFTVKVDKRIELYFVTAYISDSFFKRWLTVNDENYAKDLDNYFAEFKSHPAVTFFEETWKRDMSNYIPPEIMIYLSGSLEEQKDLKIPQEIIDHIGGSDKKDEFIKLISDFSRASNYDEFYSLHQNYYTSLSSKVLKLMKKKNCIPRLNEFYGIEHNHYYALLVPFLGVGNGYGPSIESDNGEKDVFCLFSPYQEDEQIINLLWHEFGHSFVNPVVAKNLIKVNERKDLYDPISSSMQPLYTDWENSLSEHLVRVNTTELIRSEYGKRTAKQHIRGHESQGFIYMKPFTALIENYERNRSDYPTFEAYFPQILDHLNTMKASDYLVRDVGFQGPMNAISKGVTNIIVPTNELSNEIEEKIREYTGHIKKFLEERYSTEIHVITDLEAIEADLSDGDIWVYGTLNGNLWLKDHIEEFPFIINENKIIADKTYKGNNLLFICAWPNFQNKNRGIVIHTAQRAEDIWGINGINHGPSDFIVIKGDKGIGSGDFDKDGDKWIFD